MQRPSETCSICGEVANFRQMQIIWRRRIDQDGPEKYWAHGYCKSIYFHKNPQAFRVHVKTWLEIVNKTSRRAA